MSTPIVLSFDVEEHDRIEANADRPFVPELRAHYAKRMEATTRWLLDVLAEHDTRATFFIVGQIAETHPELVRAVHRAGHEVASHGYDHRRVHRFTPETFREDLHRSCDALSNVTGVPVVGYRAPTFSIMRQTAWAIDVLAEVGMKYDSSIFPVRHDRYGVPTAPRVPFLVQGERSQLVELPPATLRLLGMNLPVGGGGYFRLFPLGVMERGLAQLRATTASASMVYFHPWEFDPEQRRLPLGRVSSFRTYVGIKRSRARLKRLLTRHRFTRAIGRRRLATRRHANGLPSIKMRQIANHFDNTEAR